MSDSGISAFNTMALFSKSAGTHNSIFGQNIYESYNDIQRRKDSIYELEGLTRMYSTLKEAGAPEDILTSLKDTMRRYIAELYYLETTKQ